MILEIPQGLLARTGGQSLQGMRSMASLEALTAWAVGKGCSRV